MDALRPGRGLLELSVVAGQAAATRVVATSPLKFLIPRRRGPAAWVYTCTFGGGLVAGDQIDMDVRLGPKVTCVMSTQSSTKVYKSPAGLPCRHVLRATVADEASLILIPDPVTCFAGARYEQDQQIELEPRSTLVAVDWLTSGRHARGERWAFARYHSRLNIFMGSDLLLADRLLLDPEDGPLGSPYRLGRFNCVAAVALVGNRFKDVRDRLLAQQATKPIERHSPIIDFASPIPHGIILRILGQRPEQVGHLVRESLLFLDSYLGDTPWARKW
ncbi:MAG: urease accessory protein UreD [Planctomycetia bacterium]|nr:urease accessory protein UreD [Planctomycetia bacterium]